MEKIKIIKEKLKEIEESKDYKLIDLVVYYELDCQLSFKDEKFADEEIKKLFYTIKNTYLKSDNANLHYITEFCIDNIKDLDNLSAYEIINKAWEEYEC